MRRFVKPVERVEVGDDGTVSSMQDEPVIEVARGLPVLGSSSSWLACEVRQALVHESHTLFIGEVIDADEIADGTAAGGTIEVLRMEDTRMNYGG